MKGKIKRIVYAVVTFVFAGTLLGGMIPVYADSGITLSPMNTRVVLTPGETYEGSFIVANPARNDEPYTFGTSVVPFFVNDNYEVTFGTTEKYSQIVDWTTVVEQSGTLEPNESTKIHYVINVPEDAPAGGQYVAINVGSINNSDQKEGINLKITYGVAYIIYAEIAGSTDRSGEIVEIDMPSFLLDGNIKASAAIKNTGNVHDLATYTMQVYPLFSGEEIYTNEEEPERMVILPGRTYLKDTIWEETPSMGIFNVVYTVEFEGTTAQVKKLVIKCPIWLLFIIIFAIIALIMYFFVRSKNRKNNKKRTQSAKAE